MHYFTPNTITDEIALRDEFAQIRENGFAEDLEETTSGGRCLLRRSFAPKRERHGRSQPLDALDPLPERRTEAGNRRAAVRETARAIQTRLSQADR